MKIAFIIDPVASFNPIAETTSFLVREFTARGFDCYGVELKNLYAQDSQIMAMGNELHVTQSKGKFSYRDTPLIKIDLEKMDAVFLRKDPPVDLSFIDHLSLLQNLEGKTLLVNSPSSVKWANEKILTLHFKDLAPATLVSQNTHLIRDFVHKHKTAVIKPLNLSGGRGVVIVKKDDPSLSSLIELATENKTRYVMAQKYLPEAKKGDKRILLLDGEILGAFLRVPQPGDFRGNLHSGAKLVKTTLSARDKKVVAQIKPELQKRGLYFVGVDMLGDWVSEINVTSPMGINEINLLTKTQTEKKVADWLEKKLAKKK